MLNAPSLANSKLLQLGENMDALTGAGVQMVHVDIMDGHYVPNLCFPLTVIGEVKQKYPEVVVDAHLMVDEVPSYVPRLAELGTDAVSFPSDATRFVRRCVSQIQEVGMRAGVVVNPSQPISVLEPYLSLVDYVVLMSVEPGFAGQRFLPGSLERLDELVSLCQQKDASPMIEIDGGVDYELAAQCLDRGAEILVTNIYTVFLPGMALSAGVANFNEKMAAAGHQHSPESLERLRRQGHSS